MQTRNRAITEVYIKVETGYIAARQNRQNGLRFAELVNVSIPMSTDEVGVGVPPEIKLLD